jgi:hypothetical protein
MGTAPGPATLCNASKFSTGHTYPDCAIFDTLLVSLKQTFVHRTRNKKTFHLNALIDGRLIRGCVSFSPAPPPGILTEVARLDATRILAEVARDDLQKKGLDPADIKLWC